MGHELGTLSPSLHQAQSWIAECGSKHRLCPLITPEEPVLPKRVLKIQNSANRLNVRLSESKSDEKARYTTLSHCWGFHPPLITTRDTLQRHCEGIKWAELPKTFQDAVVITRGLDIQFLWIDSLCIIQDSEEDWREQSAVMKDIYGFSHVTIAAAANDAFENGLHLDERTTKDKILACRSEVLTLDKPGSKLFTRAWVLQERLLASRILYFFQEEVVFECSNHIRCQCSDVSTLSASVRDPFEEDYGIVRDKAPAFKDLKYRFTDANITKIGKRLALLASGDVRSETDLWPILSTEQNIQMMDLWNEILHHYLKRNITKPSDRLPALSGIAGAFGSTGAHGVYHAGLWETWLVHTLLWYVDQAEWKGQLPSEPTEEGSTRPLAPSWSWAKLRGAWSYRVKAYSRVVLAERVDSRIELLSHDRFGAVNKGMITLKGLTIRVKLQYGAVDPEVSYAERFRRQDIELVKEGDVGVATVWPDIALDQSITSTEEVMLLALRAAHQDGEGQSIDGLVLRPAQNEEPSLHRIGVFNTPVWWFHGAELGHITIC